MIEEILTHGSGVQITDLVEASGVKRATTVSTHLDKLARAGLLTYREWDPENGLRFTLKDKQYRNTKQASPWTANAVEYLRHHEDAELEDIVDYCEAEIPADPDIDRAEIRRRVSTGLWKLKGSGAVQQTEGRSLIKNNGASKVVLSEQQEAMWTELFNRLEAFRDKDEGPATREHYRSVARALITDPEKVASLLNRAAESSARMQTALKKDLASLVLGTVVSHDGPVSIREIIAGVSEAGGRSVSRQSVEGLLKGFVDAGDINPVEGTVSRYEPRPATS
jgi:DNA-binding transcriptional ArsR family regulator